MTNFPRIKQSLVFFVLTAISGLFGIHCHDDDSSLHHGSIRHHHSHQGPCLTSDANALDVQEMQNAVALFRLSSKASPSFQRSSMETRTIPVCFHVPHNPIQRFLHGEVTDDQLQAAMEHLNKAFSSNSCCNPALSWCNSECSVETGISFAFAKMDVNGTLVPGETTSNITSVGACVTRPMSFHWTALHVGSIHERCMKSTLRKGGSGVLNVYISTIKTRGNPFLPFPILGYATWPWNYHSNPLYDGVVLTPRALPGREKIYGVRSTDLLVHEVG